MELFDFLGLMKAWVTGLIYGAGIGVVVGIFVCLYMIRVIRKVW